MSLTDSYTRTGGELRLTNHVQLELMRAVLERGLPYRFEALGFSMVPFIQHGDFITISPLNNQPVHIGDVLAFIQAHNQSLTVHRVIEIRPDVIILRGDNNSTIDFPITPGNILGIVTRIERNGHVISLGLGMEKHLIAWLNAREGLNLLRQVLIIPRHLAAGLLPGFQKHAIYRSVIKKFKPEYQIIEAEARDLIEIVARSNPGADIPPPISKPGMRFFVARHGKKLLGCVQHVQQPQENYPYVGAWLFSLMVWGAYRGMGIGEALTRRVIEQAANEGAQDLRLLVKADNSRAIQLYQKLGFQFVDPPEFRQLFKVEESKSGLRSRVMQYQITAIK